MKYLYIICLLLISKSFFAQEITNVHFEQAGKRVRIFYDLDNPFSTNKFFIQIYVSKDDGQNWGPSLKNVSGNVGENQLAGISKEIIWDVLNDEESLVGNIKFKIDAYKGDQIGFFIDKRDNQQYKWIKIGNQVWMADNLNYPSSESWDYDNIAVAEYGRLYSWKAAVNSCPKGWHLPTDIEWTKLTDQLGGANIVGRKIRTKYDWENIYFKGSNKSNFSALPAGSRKTNGTYSGKRNSAIWWSSKEYQSSSAWSRSLGFDPDEILRSYDNKSNGFSVRCIKDKE
jgi:uncharacterized protein (TIGR02145 family)